MEDRYRGEIRENGFIHLSLWLTCLLDIALEVHFSGIGMAMSRLAVRVEAHALSLVPFTDWVELTTSVILPYNLSWATRVS